MNMNNKITHMPQSQLYRPYDLEPQILQMLASVAKTVHLLSTRTLIVI